MIATHTCLGTWVLRDSGVIATCFRRDWHCLSQPAYAQGAGADNADMQGGKGSRQVAEGDASMSEGDGEDGDGSSGSGSEEDGSGSSSDDEGDKSNDEAGKERGKHSSQLGASKKVREHSVRSGTCCHAVNFAALYICNHCMIIA